jgi:hypothetical protein
MVLWEGFEMALAGPGVGGVIVTGFAFTEVMGVAETEEATGGNLRS